MKGAGLFRRFFRCEVAVGYAIIIFNDAFRILSMEEIE